MTKFRWIVLIVLSFSLNPDRGKAQSNQMVNYGQINFSNLDTWYTRPVKESFILGGGTTKLDQIGEGNRADSYSHSGAGSPWGTSNLHANLGIDIASACVFREERGDGFCCRMETRLRGIHVLGFSMDVLVTGAIFLGEFIEPVKSIKFPIKKMNHGIPFNQLPLAVKFDYKCSPGENRINTSKRGVSVAGKDMAEFCFILQRRWEEADGSVYADRIGGIRTFFNDTGNKWINGAIFPVRYGDITQEPYYDSKIMGLIPSVGPMYVKNSKGVMVELKEKSWGKKDQVPTHLVMYFNSSYQGIDFIGSPRSKFWVDNISFIY